MHPNMQVFLQELKLLSQKYDLYIDGCGCCGSPIVSPLGQFAEYDPPLPVDERHYAVDVNGEHLVYVSTEWIKKRNEEK